MCIETTTNVAMLQLYKRHDFYNLIFKMKHRLSISSRSAPHPTPIKVVDAHLWPVSGRRIESGPFADEVRILTAGQRPSARSQSSSRYPLDGSCGTWHWRLNFQWFGKRFLVVLLTAYNFTDRTTATHCCYTCSKVGPSACLHNRRHQFLYWSDSSSPLLVPRLHVVFKSRIN